MQIDPETLLSQGFSQVFRATFTIWISAKVRFHQLSRIHGFHATSGGADGKTTDLDVQAMHWPAFH